MTLDSDAAVPQPVDPASTSLEALLAANKRLALEVKMLTRSLEREQAFIRRNKVNIDARKQFSEIVLAERSTLEKNMNLLLQNSRDFIIFFDTDGRIVFCTDSFLKANNLAGFGLLKGKFFGEILGGLVPDAFIEGARHIVQAHQVGDGTSMLESQFQADFAQGGTYRDYKAELSVMVNEANESEGFVVIIYDITDFSQARREAEQANAAKSDFLATISHEIRTPMNAIIGLADMLEGTSLDARQSELLSKVQNSSTAMLSLINDILDFSKIEAGKLELIEEYFDFYELLDVVKSVFELMMAQKDLHFTCDFARDLPEVVCADSKRIRQILTNILNNAYKYTASGTVTFSVSVAEGGMTRFAVADTGIGIREEERPKLFNEFQQLDVVRNKHISGTGLGLAITKHLCEILGGSVGVESVYGKGSTFTVLLPLKAGVRDDLPHQVDEGIGFTAPKARILIVDDVEINLEIVSFMLEPFEVQIETAANGEHALGLAATNHYDLILMDHMMPVMDGIEATRRIRALDGEKGQVPIVALTANAISGVEQMFKDAGFDGFISKPIDGTILARSLHRLLPARLIIEG